MPLSTIERRMDEPRKPPAADPPPVVFYLRRDRPICPVHNIPMRMRKRVQEVRFYYCPEPHCRCSDKIALKTVKRFEP